jgi:pimeloyl-ACP methyl ester carboxylesterase
MRPVHSTVIRLAGGSALVRSGTGRIPILLLHGVGGGAWSWEPQIAGFAHDDVSVFAWEARGHGLAARVTDAGLADYHADACEALAHVAATAGPAFVAGHSMGGLLALALAAERPGALRGLALVDPVYAPDGGSHAGGPVAVLAKAVMRPLVRDVERDGPVARALSRAVFAASFRDRTCMTRAWRRQRTQVPTEYPKMMYEAFDGPSGFPNRAFAREVALPTLLFEPRDGAPRFPTLLADFARLGPRFTHLTLDGGHYLQLDRSAPEVTEALRQFVARWAA